MAPTQTEERLQALAQENRKLTDENSKLKAELRRATKLVADLAVQKFAPYEEHQSEASAE